MVSTKKNVILEKYHADEKDDNIKFYEKGHKYEVLTDKKAKYTSVTTFVHSHFPKFDANAVIASMMDSKGWGPDHKYWGQTPEQIKAGWIKNGTTVSVAGTNLHYKIECFMNNPDLLHGYTHKDLYENYHNNDNDKKEWHYFLLFIIDNPNLKPYRTEWKVYNEDWKITGTIDMVYENEDGTLSIYDWKRSNDISQKVSPFNKFSITPGLKNIPDTNYWHYTLQLNLYKAILESKTEKIRENTGGGGRGYLKIIYLIRFNYNSRRIYLG
jgi:ATP-dependent exoDNAse (exonuclease V) beta subunit